jgi:hypothetical protein
LAAAQRQPEPAAEGKTPQHPSPKLQGWEALMAMMAQPWLQAEVAELKAEASLSSFHSAPSCFPTD